MRRILWGVCEILGILCFIGGRYLQKLTRSKLGLVRWVNHLEMKTLADWPVDKLTIIVPGLTIVGVLLLLLWYLKKRKKDLWSFVTMVLVLAMECYYMFYVVTMSQAVELCYHLNIGTMFLAVVFLMIGTIGVIGTENGRDK